MKKYLIAITVALFTIGAINAQNTEDKQKVYLPEEGDFAISVDLKPILYYVGNIFNGTANLGVDYIGGEAVVNNLQGWDNDITPTASIMAKYMLNDKFALRANVGMLFKSHTTNAYVKNDKNSVLDPFNNTKLIDSQRDDKNGLSVAIGGEYRIGKKRVQGVFGASALIGFQSLSTTYSYANQITSINHNPTTSLNAPNAPISGYRVLTEKGNSDIFYGVAASAGVEWFFVPKISLGAEVNLCLYGISGGQQYVESEGWNNSTKQVETRYDLYSPGNTTFCFGTQNIGGSLYMSFYF